MASRRPQHAPPQAYSRPVAQLPQHLRRKLARDQVRDLHLVHTWLLADLRSGNAAIAELHDLAANVLTWSAAAQMLRRCEAEMRDQLALCATLLRRFSVTGRVQLSAAEDELARQGVITMDYLASIVDEQNAMVAVNWSEAMLQLLQQHGVDAVLQQATPGTLAAATALQGAALPAHAAHHIPHTPRTALSD